MANTEDLLVCTACGTQYEIRDRAALKSCRTCDDPRQFVPRDGQSFTTLGNLRRSNKYRNEIVRIDEKDDRFWSIRTEPQFAIGQRAIFIKTPQGNVLWDCIAYFDQETIEWVMTMGGIDAVVISHPHYYTTHLEWAQAFDCLTYTSLEDKAWLNRSDKNRQVLLSSSTEELSIHDKPTGIHILKVGGHFPGSLLLLAFNRLLIADTLVTTPSGLGDWSIVPPPATSDAPPTSSDIPYPATLPDSSYPSTAANKTISHPIGQRPDGMNSYVFMWSIPNMIPLNPVEVIGIWNTLKVFDFTSTHGAFRGFDIYDGENGSGKGVKERILDSMQIQIRRMGWEEHEFLNLKI